MAQTRDTTIQRQVSRTTGGKPETTYARVDQPLGHIQWVARAEQASQFEYNVASMLCFALNQTYEQTMVGPSYWVHRS